VKNELLQTTFQAITHPDDLDTDLSYVEQLLLGSIDNYQVEKRYQHKQGHYIWVQLNVSLIHDPEGKPFHFISQIQDITERLKIEKTAQEHARRFEAIFNQTYQFIGLLSPQGILLEVNHTAEIQPEAVLGKPFWETPWWSHSITLQKKVKESIAIANSGTFVRFEATHPTPSGEFINVDFSLKPLLDENGEVKLLIPEGRDITYIKKIEKEHHNMLEKLQEVDKMRRNFVSTLTHDLRTPLIAQKRVLNLLQNNPVISQDQELSFLIKDFLQNNAGLLQMVNNLLVTYELEDGQIKPIWNPVNLYKLTQECFNELQSVLEEKGILIENKIPPMLQPIEADEMLLKRLFRNLIGNAVANIPANCQITLLASDWGTYIDLSVKDNGPGIPEELIPYVFSRYLSGSTTRRKIGSGLGLYICKMISELHNGTIRVDSTPTTGTTMSITLPIQRPIS
jgi:PAS domain S-box-containing protein